MGSIQLRCFNCDFENPADVRYCGACGTLLKRLCAVCHQLNPLHFNFCGTCGSPLSGEKPVERRQARSADGPSTRTVGDPERRQLTVMFCDLVGSTALSLSLDPEVLRDVVRSYQAACAAVIEQFGGYIAQYLGDGVLTYFGYPVALEEEADRAVGAGVGILEAITALNEQLLRTHSVTLAVRIGIHTGMVVVGEVGSGTRREQLALGDTPNIAARLQGLALPQSVVVSSETYRLIARSFECEELGRHAIRGMREPEPIYRVLRVRRLADLEHDSRVSSLLGREHELKLLLDRWELVQRGEGRVICLSGDPGIGKTHLVREFLARTATPAAVRLEARCLPHYRFTAFHPFLDLLQRGPGGLQGYQAPHRLEAIATLLGESELRLETSSSSSLVVSVPTSRSSAATLPERPQSSKERLKSGLVQLLLRLAQDEPLILLVEDLHWADPSTLEVMDLLVESVPASRLFVLLAFRPEFGLRWAAYEHVTHVYLGRLRQRQAEALMAEVAGGKALPPELVARIVERTDGVPLFIEELTRMLLESAALIERDGRYELSGSAPPLAIPTTLRDSLEARLDRLPDAREVAQLASAIGREFSFPLLRAVSTATDESLTRALEDLVQAGLLYAYGSPPDSTYAFKQALIQEAAYESLARSTRQRYHQSIATALRDRFLERVDARPELLAHHYAAAGLVDEAVQAWRLAGQRALERSATLEAIAFLRNGLEQVASVAEPGNRTREELQLLLALAPALAATRGYAAPELHEVYGRARDLARELNDTGALARVLVGLFAYHFVRAELATAHGLARELLELAERTADAPAALAAHATLGLASLGSSELAAARQHLDHVTRIYDAGQHAALAVTFGQDFGVVALAHSALLLSIIGCPDQAQARARQALVMADELGHPHSTALALSAGAAVHYYAREVESVHEWAQRLAELATRYDFGRWRAEARFLLAWVAAERGHVEEALAALEGEVAPERNLGSLLPLQSYQRVVAELYGRTGRAAEGLRMLDLLEAAIRDSQLRVWWESELYRVRAELMLLADPDDASAEAEFLRALDVARTRRARSLELRAVLGVAALWRQRGRPDEARTLLADCHEGFTEGFDTPDLIRTRQLLDELGATTPG